MDKQIRDAVHAVKSSPYEKAVILLIQYVQYYCSGKAPFDLPDSIYDYIVKDKWSEDPLVDMLANSDVSAQAQMLASIIMNYECDAFHGELTDEIEEANNLVLELLYA